MKRQKRRTDKQLQRIIGIVCLSFLLGTAGGALLANLLPKGQQGQLSAFLQQALADGDEIGFAAIFWKYLKYDIIIWLGGWMQLGLFFAGAAFLFRSVCVGFTSAMMMAAYGMKGVLLSATAFLPQNLLLIPCYILMMSACIICFPGRRRAASGRCSEKNGENSWNIAFSLGDLCCCLRRLPGWNGCFYCCEGFLSKKLNVVL